MGLKERHLLDSSTNPSPRFRLHPPVLLVVLVVS